MPNHDTTLEEKLDNIETHAHRAWALASMLQTYLDQDMNRLTKEVLTETVDEIWEKLDAIGAELHHRPEAAQ
ncbi:hypothetical protein [Billgrantia montanilacus]|uniref:Uncharacterized protein n=1 Tax=Billgrantia montanilacus TaxID=2282305 RepID=A0A368TSA4_9GAMM|nr:hypothetical protein [Halomonas montanilacus]RCV87498.1 hypothetical protein DU505_17145 [Halomonas montanilacus]